MLRFLRSPKFWNDKDNKISRFLEPLSKLYYIISKAKLNSVVPEKAQVPVICIGNIVLGGSGKTPTVELVCDILKNNNLVPHILTAGYGGYLKNVVRVDPRLHSYLQVGDEALLSVEVAPTWIGKNRINSGKAAVLAGANILVMDDGFQNNSIAKDIKILVIDSGQEFGNSYLFPAGPLREPIKAGITKSDIVLIIGEKNPELEEKIHIIDQDIPIFRAKMDAIEFPEVENNKVVGFCGLGYPLKFKKTLIECGYDLVDFISFSDHHPYTITEIQKLISGAKNVGATLITTMKDFVKIPEVFKNEIKVVKIKLRPETDEFKNFIISTLSEKNYRF